MFGYVFGFDTGCSDGESVIICHVWVRRDVPGLLWLVELVGSVQAHTVEEALAEARIIADEDRAIREYRE